MPEFAPVINVSTLNGINGFRLDGAAADYSGTSLSSGGDVNGDNIADLLIGATYSDVGGADRGAAWVVFGAAASPAAQTLAARVAAGTAYRFQGEAAGDYAGSISNAGDVNGDGFDDFIIGASQADPDAVSSNRGASYIVFGGTTKLEAFDATDGVNDNQVALNFITPGTGFRFDGASNSDSTGASVSGAGDINGDGIDDLLIGAPGADPASGIPTGNEGASYIVFGGANLTDLDDDDGLADGRIDLSQISPGQGLRLDGVATFQGDLSGISVAVLGDVNGDGFDDALIGSLNADPNGTNTSEGAAWLVLGRPNALFTSSNLILGLINGSSGVSRFDGVTGLSSTGRGVGALGDINGDGLADFAIGAQSAGPSGLTSGAAYVVFGRGAFSVSNDLADLDGSDGFRLEGARSSDYAGLTVGSAGDVNGDGFDDVLVSANGFDRPGVDGVGAVFVVFGKAAGFDASINLGGLGGNTGFRIEGALAGDRLGRGNVSGSDVNGDGFSDIIVSAYGADNNSLYNSGSTYVIYGKRAESAVTRVGTDIANIINGGKGSDTISGLSGNDTLIGWEGADVIDAGDGDDTVNAGIDNDTVAGGLGNDTINAGTGSDHVEGEAGTDTIIGDTGDDTIDAGDGNDTVSAGADDDEVSGGAGNDSIDGSTGDDTLFGNSGDDTLTGGSGNDVVRGGSGRDLFAVGAGEDEFFGGGDKDVLDFASFGSTPVVVDLATGSFVFNSGEDVTTFRSVEDVRGGNGADQISGNSLVNLLIGGLGNDRLDGRAGNDAITGQGGKDTLSGGGNSDRFIFQSASDSAVATLDEITDFAVDLAVSSAFVDRIDLSAIDAKAGGASNDAFSYIGSAAFTAEGQIRAVASGADTRIEINISGTSGAEMAILLKTFTAANLAAVDFVL